MNSTACTSYKADCSAPTKPLKNLPGALTMTRRRAVTYEWNSYCSRPTCARTHVHGQFTTQPCVLWLRPRVGSKRHRAGCSYQTVISVQRRHRQTDIISISDAHCQQFSSLERSSGRRQDAAAITTGGAFILIAGTLAGEISRPFIAAELATLGTAVLFACLGLHLRIKTSDALMVQALFWMVTSFCYALYGRGSTTQRAIFFTGHLALLAILQGPPDLSSFVKNGCLVLAASTGMSFALNIEMRRDIVAERVSPRSRGERREGAPPEDALPQDAAESTDGSSSDLVHSGDDANDEADGNAAGNVESYRPAESPYQLTLSGRSATSDTLSSGTKSSVTTTSAPAAHHSPSVFESLSQDVEFREKWVEQLARQRNICQVRHNLVRLLAPKPAVSPTFRAPFPAPSVPALCIRRRATSRRSCTPLNCMYLLCPPRLCPRRPPRLPPSQCRAHSEPDHGTAGRL